LDIDRNVSKINSLGFHSELRHCIFPLYAWIL
jgi:hypothetical protein